MEKENIFDLSPEHVFGTMLVPFSQQALVKDLRALSYNCRSNSCIEHATGIMEEEKIPERLSKGVSTISLTGQQKKV